jgi:hypothetical protein
VARDKAEQAASQRIAAEVKKTSALDRMIAQAIGADRKLGLDDDPARQRWPTLWDWLTRIYVGRDNIKQPATITIRLGPDGALATLTDRDLGCSLDASSPTLEGLFQALEAALTADACPLRIWGKKEPTVRKRRGGGSNL